MKINLSFMKLLSVVFLLSMFACSVTSTDNNRVSTVIDSQVESITPVQKNGALKVVGNQILNKRNQPPMLAGPSFFWSNNAWQGAKFYRKNVVDYFIDDWDASMVRAAIAVKTPGGYLDDPQSNLRRAEVLIDAAIAKGVYVILDWHSHDAENNLSKAKEFFTYFAEKYGEYDNVIYEIYNEPLRDTDWKTVIKPYSEEMIKTIRAIDPDNLIIVGSQSWSQDVDKSSLDPIIGFKNIAYSLHFYAGTHKEGLRAKAKTAMANGLALMVTEWGGVNANGDGEVDEQSVAEWMDFMQEYKLSHANWSVCDKKEGASIFKPNINVKKEFSDNDLTRSGIIVKKIVQTWK